MRIRAKLISYNHHIPYNDVIFMNQCIRTKFFTCILKTYYEVGKIKFAVMESNHVKYLPLCYDEMSVKWNPDLLIARIPLGQLLTAACSSQKTDVKVCIEPEAEHILLEPNKMMEYLPSIQNLQVEIFEESPLQVAQTIKNEREVNKRFGAINQAVQYRNEPYMRKAYDSLLQYEKEHQISYYLPCDTKQCIHKNENQIISFTSLQEMKKCYKSTQFLIYTRKDFSSLYKKTNCSFMFLNNQYQYPYLYPLYGLGYFK